MKTYSSVTCSAAELGFMASLLGVPSLIGVPDPFSGLLAEQVNEAWVSVRQALASRGLLHISGGMTAVDDSVAALLVTCGAPDASLIVTWSASGKQPIARVYHLTAALSVEVVAHPDPTTCELIPLTDTNVVGEKIVDLFGLTALPSPSAPPGTLPEPALMQARQVLQEQGANAADQFLQQSGLGAETALALRQTLAAPIGNGAVANLTRRNAEWEAGGFGVLAGENGAWLLETRTQGGSPWVAVTPCAGTKFSARIGRLLERTLADVVAR